MLPKHGRGYSQISLCAVLVPLLWTGMMVCILGGQPVKIHLGAVTHLGKEFSRRDAGAAMAPSIFKDHVYCYGELNQFSQKSREERSELASVGQTWESFLVISESLVELTSKTRLSKLLPGAGYSAPQWSLLVTCSTPA